MRPQTRFLVVSIFVLGYAVGLMLATLAIVRGDQTLTQTVTVGGQ